MDIIDELVSLSSHKNKSDKIYNLISETIHKLIGYTYAKEILFSEKNSLLDLGVNSVHIVGIVSDIEYVTGIQFEDYAVCQFTHAVDIVNYFLKSKDI